MPQLHDGIRLPDAVEIYSCIDDKIIQANLLVLDRNLAKNGIDARWWREVRDACLLQTRRSEFDWGKKWADWMGQVKAIMGRTGFALCLQTPDSQIQGGIIYQTGVISGLEPDMPMVYCHRLATATWNRQTLVSEPCFRGVGTGLLRMAVLHSRYLNCGGRIALEVDPGTPAREWYLDFGFVPVSEAEGKMSELELPSDVALKIIEGVIEES